MTLYLMTLLIFDLGGVAKAPLDPFATHPQIDKQGGIVYFSTSEVLHWKNGQLTRFDVGNGISSVFFSGSYYWVVNQEGNSFWGVDGRFLGRFEGEAVEIQHSSSTKPIVRLRLNQKYLKQSKLYPPLATIVEVDFTSPITVSPLMDFSKSTQRALDLSLEFTRLWVVEKSGTFYVLDQIDPQIRVYDNQAINREIMQGWKVPDLEVMRIPLRLDRYTSMHPKYLDNIEGLLSMNEGMRLMKEWWNTAPLFVFFGEMGKNSYLVAYRVPVYEKKRAIGFRLAVQRLGAAPNFSPRGPLLLIPEIQSFNNRGSAYHIAGTFDGSVIVFHLNCNDNGVMAPTMDRYRFENSQWKKW